MSNLLVVNCTSGETRVALVEDGSISEFYIERHHDRGIVGNVYKGKVLSVLPGMQAAFVDIGQEKAGFLHVSDFYNFTEDIAATDDDNVDDWPPPSRSNRKRHALIEDVLKEKQEIIVQIAKDPIGTKGARLTGHISLPGRYVVFMPTVSHIGISKRIGTDRERKRLRRIVDRARPDGAGFIVRTVSENVPEEKLLHDINTLMKMWSDMLDQFGQVSAPNLLSEEPDLILRAARDLYSPNLERLVIDDERAYDRISKFTEQFMPGLSDSVQLYKDDEPIFDAFGIEIEINRALQRKVELKSGGHLVIDKTEALTAIDINTGRFVGKSSSLEDTIFKTNMEAAEEIAYQLKLRNIGGLIIIDFIDMDDPKNRDRVYRKLEQELQKDKVTSNTLAISEFGLVEMTRKRVRESLVQQLGEPCPYCEGRGFVKSRETLAFEILREIKRDMLLHNNKHVHVYAHPEVISVLRYKEKQSVRDVEKRWNKKIHLHHDQEAHIEQFHISMNQKQGTQKNNKSQQDSSKKESSSKSASSQNSKQNKQEHTKQEHTEQKQAATQNDAQADAQNKTQHQTQNDAQNGDLNDVQNESAESQQQAPEQEQVKAQSNDEQHSHQNGDQNGEAKKEQNNKKSNGGRRRRSRRRSSNSNKSSSAKSQAESSN